MIKSLLENGCKSDEQTKEYIEELDLNLAERDTSTRRIDRYRADLSVLKDELAQWRNKCAQAQQRRDEIYQQYKLLQRDIEFLERAKRDRSQLNRSSPNLSACSSMVGGGGQIPPPPPPADITYDEILNMTGNQPSSSLSYLADFNNMSSNNHHPYSAGAIHPMIPPPPSPPNYTGDKFLEPALPKAKIIRQNGSSTGFM